MSRILIVDDEQAVCWALQKALSREGHKVQVASSAEEAFGLASKHLPEAIFLDVRLPGIDGLSAMGRLREITHEAPVIVVTAFGNLSTAVRAVEGGAFDYLAKPFDLDQALETVQRALQRRPTQEAASEAPPPAPSEEIVGASPAMQAVFKRIALVAPRDSCVLITGESGTGKELAARAIHRYSSRRDKPFLPVHVAALNPNLVESELFGHVKGAFTGAAQARPGLFNLADGGTLFFDEVAEIPLHVQVKLLRVLEHAEVFPVGGNQAARTNVRILAATHQDLQKKVMDGSFRHDLYFRLNVFQIQLPALRDRADDILPLAEHFLRRIEPGAWPLVPETIEALIRRPWLGNVRELHNALEHAVIVARGSPILPEHIPANNSSNGSDPKNQLSAAVLAWVQDRVKATGANPPSDLYSELLSCVEPPLLEEIMRRLEGNRWAAAQWLGLNRATVRKKLTHYGLADISRGDLEDEDSN